MKKNNTIILLLLMGLFISCEQLEEITSRDYPFVESISVSDINETGVTVNFEIRKNGASPITSYGLEYWVETFNGRQPNIQKVTRSGAPESSVVDLRISYDMIKAAYLVQPYVCLLYTSDAADE